MLSTDNLEQIVRFGGLQVFGRLRSTSRMIQQACHGFGKRFLVGFLRNKVELEPLTIGVEFILWEQRSLEEIEIMAKYYLLSVYEVNLRRIGTTILEADKSVAAARWIVLSRIYDLQVAFFDYGS